MTPEKLTAYLTFGCSALWMLVCLAVAIWRKIEQVRREEVQEWHDLKQHLDGVTPRPRRRRIKDDGE